MALLIEQGTLTVRSPSGIEGQLNIGKGLVLDSGTSPRLRNLGAEVAEALLVGIVPAGGGLLTRPDASPVATMAPTKPSAPAATMTATAAPVSEVTPPGTVLANHATWHAATALLTLDGTTEQSAMNGETILDVALGYANTGAGSIDFVVRPVFIRVADDAGQIWGNMGTGGMFNHTDPQDQRVILGPGESQQFQMQFLGPVLSGDRRITIAIEEFGAVRSAKWFGVIKG
ncbi:MAG: hypothetical protein ACR2OO_06805 [Thermomicrobiales bacterium]